MRIHEHQAKALLQRHGVPVPAGEVVATAPAAQAAAVALGCPVAVKAQIHAGGRGKGGGIALASSPEEAAAAAERILGMQLITPQTGPAGRRVKSVLVESATEVVREVYLGIALDRARARPVVMASADGGMDIETVAATHPERILTVAADPALGLLPFQAHQLVRGLGLDTAAQVKAGIRLLLDLYAAYLQNDCSLAEINPLVVTGAGELLALDAKMNLDDNALYRHPELAALRDPDEEEPLEVAASAAGLNYIKLDGNIGCMVNGAGLAMATMDIIKLAGGEPANFLDVGGGASAQTVESGFRLLLTDPSVRAILVNIFGGIVRCDRVAEGVIQARRNVAARVPIVVRLAGTNADIAAKLLADSGLDFVVASNLEEAAARAVACSR